jgi:hypothetical protein
MLSLIKLYDPDSVVLLRRGFRSGRLSIRRSIRESGSEFRQKLRRLAEVRRAATTAKSPAAAEEKFCYSCRSTGKPE